MIDLYFAYICFSYGSQNSLALVSDIELKSDELRNKTSVTVFYRGNKQWVRVWVHMSLF